MFKPWTWCVLSVLFASAVLAAPEFKPQPFDWPQWQGPDRTTISRETGLLKTWPKEGPPLAWKVSGMGGGYCTPSVAAGRIVGMSYRGDDEVVWALDETNGKELWQTRIAAANRRVGYGDGSRCTPTVDGNVLYALGVSGDLVCLNVADGQEVWRKNLVKDFKGNVPGWGYSESPLVDGEKLIATPGGKQATLVALNKKNGETIWQAQVPQGDGAQYASVIAADVNGQRQYIQFLRGGVVGVAAADGKFLWRYNKPANGTANISTAIYFDQCVFGASGYGTGGGLVKLTPDGSMIKADEVYFTKDMKNHHGGMVLLDGFLYGANDGNELVCLEFKTGTVKWRERKPGKGSIAFADGRLYYRNEGGSVVLVEAKSDGYVECGRFNQPERSKKPAWPHPVVANGKLYLLDQDTLFGYDVKQR